MHITYYGGTFFQFQKRQINSATGDVELVVDILPFQQHVSYTLLL